MRFISMSLIRVRDLDELRRVLEDPSMFDVYRSIAGFEPVSAVVEMRPHPDGCAVDGRDGRWWIYVRVVGEEGAVYDIALWKILRFPEARERLGNVVEIGSEPATA